ncbi:MAG: HdeD family acid-resistance protein [Pirellulales bacterium]|nr:HdeD family acid-resistance protein [Pirellulales bacterium]
MESTFSRPLDVMPLGINEVRRHWGWFLALGVLMALIGIVALGWSFTTTMVSMVFLGWLLVCSGAIEVAHAFWKRKWSGFFLDLLAGILYGGIGFLILANPCTTAVTLTFMVAVLLLFGGVYRLVAAVTLQPPHEYFVFLNGAVSLLLGLMIWRGWPFDGLWVIGLFVGIDMIFNGLTLVMLALNTRKLSHTQTA